MGKNKFVAGIVLGVIVGAVAGVATISKRNHTQETDILTKKKIKRPIDSLLLQASDAALRVKELLVGISTKK